jgi:hypothetical protein
MRAEAFDPASALHALHEGGVRFVVIGGIAGRLWGSPTVTGDLDICYARDAGNLEALTHVLRRLGARLRGAPEDVPFQLDAQTLAAGDHFTFVTRAGNLDILGHPAGSTGFDALRARATAMDVGDIDVWVVSLDDLIKMKRAAGRARDLRDIEILTAVRDERKLSGESE